MTAIITTVVETRDALRRHAVRTDLALTKILHHLGLDPVSDDAVNTTLEQQAEE